MPARAWGAENAPSGMHIGVNATTRAMEGARAACVIVAKVRRTLRIVLPSRCSASLSNQDAAPCTMTAHFQTLARVKKIKLCAVNVPSHKLGSARSGSTIASSCPLVCWPLSGNRESNVAAGVRLKVCGGVCVAGALTPNSMRARLQNTEPSVRVRQELADHHALIAFIEACLGRTDCCESNFTTGKE